MAISKIKVNGTEHELQTTIANVTNLQSSLDAKQATVTGGASTITSSNLTGSRALISNSSGKVAVSDITSTELGYLDGARANIQNQLDAKMSDSITSLEMNASGSLKNYGGFIDFHYHNSDGKPTNSSGTVVSSTPDYTSRIIEDSAGTISVNGVRMNSSTITGSLNGTATTATKLGSSTVGGAAKPIYLNGGTATACSSTVGSATQPVYMNGGTITAGSYTLGKSVPSDAVFTDTNTWRGIQNNLTSTSTSDSLSAYQGKILNESKASWYSWTASAKIKAWSRLCYVACGAGVVGCSFLLNVSGTRNCVVYNDTYVIKAHHSFKAFITKISGSNYSTGLQLRAVSDSSGNCYVELYDNAANNDNATYQSVNCRLISIFTGAVTKYTSFTDGTTLPTNFTANATLTTNTNSLQGNLTWGEITGKPSTYTPASHTHNVSHTPAGSISSTSITPAGSVSSTFTGKAVTSGAPSGTATVASSSHTHKYTPSGTVSKPTFTGSAVTSGAPSGTTSVYSITGVGSVPSLSASVTNRCLTLSFSAGSVPTRSQVTVASSGHTHSVTASGAVSQPTFTGTEASTTSISGTTSVASSGHTHSVTASGTVGSTFTGTAASHSHTFTGTAATLTTGGVN